MSQEQEGVLSFVMIQVGCSGYANKGKKPRARPGERTNKKQGAPSIVDWFREVKKVEVGQCVERFRWRKSTPGANTFG